jgi:segregation and condensation protein A
MNMTDYRVELDSYNGPLDLLLFLVKRHEIDLYDIPIAKLTDQYLAYLQQIERIDMDLAGEFLVMAATLVEIKSQLLLPRQEQAVGDDSDGLDALDPRFELVQQLLAYKAYKDAALQLDDRRDQWDQRFAHAPAKVRDNGQPADAAAEEQVEIDLEDADVMDLVNAFSRILESIGQSRATHDVVYDDTPIGLHADDILDRLQRLGEGKTLSLAEAFAGRTSRGELIGLFLATLELVNQKKITVKQDKAKGEIHLLLRPESEHLGHETDAPDWRDPETGQVQYDWPSEGIRRRFEKRQQRRADRLARGEFGADPEEDAALDIDDEDDIDDADEDCDENE